ncbi:10232_t:CDS:10 [Acaulospora morrowiae]|uniref:Nuclear pore complex protein n=1 Tax=Acaulospora morrowiae TaxID=94023 RepID=A0A9N9A2N1_9GLOM|nr:10232_t:CDS:10 [Acaulospora morrowiae]
MSSNTSMTVDSPTPRATDAPLNLNDLTRFYTPNTQVPRSFLSANQSLTGNPNSYFNNNDLDLVGDILTNNLGDYGGTHDVYIKFAQAYSRNSQQMDLQRTPESYEELCDLFLKIIEGEHVRTFASEYKQCNLWEIERNTWNLINQLQILRSTHPKDLNIPLKPYLTEGELLGELIATKIDFAEACVCIHQCFKYNMISHELDLETHGEIWSETKSHILYTLKDESNKYLDPDGPYRNKTSLLPTDQIHDKELAKSVFEYLRRGQIHNACDICEKNGQYFRSSCISGSIIYHENQNAEEDAVEGTGNINRSLTRAIFYRNALEVDLDIYERAYNAVLCGDVDNVAPVCRTWEDYVWAYYNGLIECKQEQYFDQRGRISRDVCDEELPVPMNLLNFTPEDIFRSVEALKVDKSPLLKIFHKVQELFILNNTDEIVKFLKVELLDKQLRQKDNAAYSQIICFAAHFVLFLRDMMIPSPDQESDDIIKSYTELLIEYQQESIIALYASKLSRELSVETYALFLKGITASYDERFELYKLAEKHGLNVKAIARKTFDMIFDEPKTEEKYGYISLRNGASSDTLTNPLDPPLRETNDPVEPHDSVKIRGLEWLTFNKDQMIEAFDRANALCRRFLAKGKLNAVKTLFREISNSKSPLSSYNIDEKKSGYEYSVLSEYSFYYTLTDFFSKNEYWVKIEREKSLDQTSYSRDITKWSMRIREATETLEKLFDKFLYALARDSDEDDLRTQELEQIKDIYVPNIVLRLHHVYEKTQKIIPANLNKSFHLANLIADENQQLYIHFRRAKKLPTLIECIKSSYLAIIRDNPSDVILY